LSSGKKSATKASVASYDDKRKGLRQATMAKDKTSDTLSLVIPAATAPVGASLGRTKATPSASTTPAAVNGDFTPHPHTPGSSALQPPAIVFVRVVSQVSQVISWLSAASEQAHPGSVFPLREVLTEKLHKAMQL
jgi:hypothetical protein